MRAEMMSRREITREVTVFFGEAEAANRQTDLMRSQDSPVDEKMPAGKRTCA
jgi:hypothetical protein